MRTSLTLAAAVLCAVTLSACGSSGSGSGGSSSSADNSGQSAAERTASYCSDYKRLQSVIDTEEPPSIEQLEDFSDQIGDLSDEAPDAVRSDWKTVESGFGGLLSALRSTGVTPKQFAQASQGKAPDGVSSEDLAAVREAGQALDSAGVDKAFKAIDSNAASACKGS